MRCMVLVKASPQSEAGEMGPPELYEEMGRFNDRAHEGRRDARGRGAAPELRGRPDHFDGDAKTVIDGPFAETKELVAGFWILQVRSLDEAVEWIKRSPFREGTVEIRQIFEAEDFGDALPAEVREAEERLRAELADRR